ncbi:MAG: pyridoxal 5'-phosphate synthase glutaminase subunit PdxT [Prevotella sp.]|nr:pyridoxal 5'-phosphate synthase glutaminase subunit PdxT [Prevotella sp.]
MRIAILALQGAFAEHGQMLHRLGVETFEVRRRSDWDHPKDGLIIPGGESTTQGKLLRELGLFEPIRQAISDGLPVFGTCAGLILLSPMHLGTMDIDVCRNAYGRQLGSFRTVGPVKDVGDDVPMTFIRAPYINKVLSGKCEPLAVVDGHIVAARQGCQLATAFHPELDSDRRVHEYFLRMAAQSRPSSL